MPYKAPRQGSPRQILHSQDAQGNSPSVNPRAFRSPSAISSRPPRGSQAKQFARFSPLGPKKHLGQNFLVNTGVVTKLLDAAELTSKDTVLEVGPGLGALTRELATRVKQVIAVEKDRYLAMALAKEISRVNIIEQDILKFSLKDLPKNYKVVANLPFAITAPLIRKFLEDDNPPSLLVLLVQKEVAQRICARHPDMNLLAASVQFYCQPRLVSVVKKGVFWPQPKVDAAILKLTPFGKKPSVAPSAYFQVMKAGFLHPRKQLMNNLREGLDLDKDEVEKLLAPCGISSAQRAETLSVSDWITVAKRFTMH